VTAATRPRPARLLGLTGRPSPLVLGYHSVRPGRPHALWLAPERFRDQLAELHELGYRGATFTDVALGRADEPAVAVTFDDSFAAVARWAEPVLDELGWPATVFAPTDAVDRGAPLAWLATGPPGEAFEPLTWEELARLRAKGWEVGSHTRSHRLLSLLDQPELEDELAGSREAVLERVGSCTAISYPWGEVDGRVVETARAAGYLAGTGLRGRFRAGDPLQVPRVAVSGRDGSTRFALKTTVMGDLARRSPAWPLAEAGRERLRDGLVTVSATGPGVAGRKLVSRVASARHAIGIACDLRGCTAASDPELAIEVVEPLFFPELPALLAEAEGPDHLFLRALERTRRASAGELVVARRDGKPVAFHFVHLPEHRRALDAVAPGLYPPLAPGEALTEAVFTVPEERGRGYARTMLDWTLARLSERGVERALAWVDVANRPSLRVFAQVGFRPGGTMRTDRFRLGRLGSTFTGTSPEVLAAWDEARR